MASLSETNTKDESKSETKSENKTTANQATISSESEEEFFPLSFFKNHKFESASKRISHHAHIGKFLTSPTYTKLIKFLNDLADAVKEEKLSCKTLHQSSTTVKCLLMLDELNKYCDAIEPLQIQSRYGNKAYRIWHDKLQKESKQLINALLPWSETEEKDNETKLNIIAELHGYLCGSFGDYTRIDYGTGHELTFICFLLILAELRIFRRSDYKCIVLLIFNKYVLLMRKIQTKYGLEPAGTKGVWGLDDYQFLPFYFGASQLINNPHNIKPNDILNKEILSTYCDDYLYLSCIRFILKMKTGQFHEHSPLLFDISGVPFWFKVKKGLLKMYMDDVLKKFPVIQHFLFASVLSIDLPPITANNPNVNNEKQDILKRKQALIDKLNAKNPKFVSEKQKEKEKQEPMVMTAAPWAQTNNSPNDNNTNSDSVVTKAPWAK